MNHILPDREVLEDFDAIFNLRRALDAGDNAAASALLAELSTELCDDYKGKISEKIERWINASVVHYFYDAPCVKTYLQAKMLYRDGFFEATIMVCRSICEMICYQRLDVLSHPFGDRVKVEMKSFRDLIKWLNQNDPLIDASVFKLLNDMYDVGNNYIHPKAGFVAKDDSLKSLHLIGQAVTQLFGLKSIDDMVGRTVRSPYPDFQDICSGFNLLLSVYATPEAAIADMGRCMLPSPTRCEGTLTIQNFSSTDSPPCRKNHIQS